MSDLDSTLQSLQTKVFMSHSLNPEHKAALKSTMKGIIKKEHQSSNLKDELTFQVKILGPWIRNLGIIWGEAVNEYFQQLKVPKQSSSGNIIAGIETDLSLSIPEWQITLPRNTDQSKRPSQSTIPAELQQLSPIQQGESPSISMFNSVLEYIQLPRPRPFSTAKKMKTEEKEKHSLLPPPFRKPKQWQFTRRPPK